MERDYTAEAAAMAWTFIKDLPPELLTLTQVSVSETAFVFFYEAPINSKTCLITITLPRIK